MPPTIPTTTQRYENALRPLTALLDGLYPAAVARALAMEGWDVRAVVDHLIDTQRDFLVGHGLDLGPAPDVDGDPALAWRTHGAAVTALLSEDEVVTTPYDGHFGPTTIGDSLQRFYVFDMVVHRWDVARAVGSEEAFTDSELDQLEAGIASFGEAIHIEGDLQARRRGARRRRPQDPSAGHPRAGEPEPSVDPSSARADWRRRSTERPTTRLRSRGERAARARVGRAPS